MLAALVKSLAGILFTVPDCLDMPVILSFFEDYLAWVGFFWTCWITHLYPVGRLFAVSTLRFVEAHVVRGLLGTTSPPRVNLNAGGLVQEVGEPGTSLHGAFCYAATLPFAVPFFMALDVPHFKRQGIENPTRRNFFLATSFGLFFFGCFFSSPCFFSLGVSQRLVVLEI